MSLAWLRKLLRLEGLAARDPVKTVATIGYEGTTLSNFIDTLKLAKVQTILDVRAIPLSRRKGFSKNVLANALEANGIAYFHLRDLGNPKSGRNAARNGQVSQFQRIFLRHLRTLRARKALKEALGIVSQKYTCLLCLEYCPSECHRSMVADALAKKGNLNIVHLSVQEKGASNGLSKKRERARGNLSQSAAAAQ
jgi:uncharacterized protein (DUF488 family)